MTVEQFLNIKSNDRLYNLKQKQYCQVSGPIYAPKEVDINDIPGLVAVIMTGEVQDLTYKIHVPVSFTFTMSGYNYSHISIALKDRDEWEVITSLNEIDDQKFINRILMHEIEQLKLALESVHVRYLFHRLI